MPRDATSAAPPRAARLPRYEQLDAFRLIVIAVVTFHSFQHSQGPTGYVLPVGTIAESIASNLDLLLAFYFVMAGFGVAVQLLRSTIAGKAPPTARDFLAKRLARLVPLYLLIFLVVWELRYSGTARQWEDLLWGVTLMQSWSDDHIFATIDPAWYLSVEIGFVLTIAVVMLPVLRRIAQFPSERRRWQGVIGVAAFFIVLSALWKLQLAQRGVSFDAWGSWFSPPAWMDLWGFGMLFGLAVMRWDRPDRWAARGIPLLITVASLSWLWLLVVLSDDGHLSRSVRWDASSLGLMGLMLASVLAPPQRLGRRIMASGPVQMLAACSFGVFLWHAPLLRWWSGAGALPLDSPANWVISTLALLALSSILAFFSLKWIELPGQSLARLHLPQRERRWADARPVPASLRVGDPSPPALAAVLGETTLPLVVLIAPADSDRPPGAGDPSSIALRALSDEQFVVRMQGGEVAALLNEHPMALERRVRFDRVTVPALPVDGATLAQGIGVGGIRHRNGHIVPTRTVVVIGEDGTVAAMLTGPDGAALVLDAVDAATAAGRRTPSLAD